jgi:DNA-binding SARP family transcriptional activator/alpha-beta hydrolase superfamily lysophospholipase
MTVRLLGGLLVEEDGRTVATEAALRRSAGTLVKLLALSPDHRLHRERLLDALWPDVAPVDAAPRLHKAAHYARRDLGRPDAVVVQGDMVALLPTVDLSTDVEVFEQAADAALASGDREAARAAAELYGGELLPGDIYEDWSDDIRRRLAVKHAALLRQGECWEELLRVDPTDEAAHAALIRRHVAAGDKQAALRQFEWLDVAMRRELGTAPSAELEALRAELTAALRSIGPLSPVEDTRLTQSIRFCATPDGVDLAYAVTGEGSPLVKAANWMTNVDHDWNSPVWRHWLVALSQGRQLIRYDERGCGLSDWEVADHSFEAWVSDLETVVDAAGLDRFPLLGISQGAAVAVAYAARHPERVSRLVLYGGYVQGRRLRSRTPEELSRHELEIHLAEAGWGSDQPAFRQVFTAQFMPQGSKQLWAEFNELQRLSVSPENAARVLRTAGTIDVVDAARQVQAPTLVLHARHDGRPPFEQGLRLASLIPDSQFIALDSDNHILLEDEPAWPVFLAAVNGFLAG